MLTTHYPCSRLVLTGHIHGCSVHTTRDHGPSKDTLYTRVHGPCSQVLRTHYPYSWPVLMDSVYSAWHCHPQKAFHPQSAKSHPLRIGKFGLKMPTHIRQCRQTCPGNGWHVLFPQKLTLSLGPYMVPWVHRSPQPKWIRISSAILAQLTSVWSGMPRHVLSSKNCVFTWADPDPYVIIHGSLDPPMSKSKTASQLVRLFLHSSRQRVTILYNGPPLFPLKTAFFYGGYEPPF